MVTNLVHLQNAITEPCVPEEVSRVLRSSKRWWGWGGGGEGGGVGPAPWKKTT